MNTKEQAEELLYKFDDNVEHSIQAIDLALEIINETMQGFLDADIVAYWQQVKVEIKKL